MRAVRCVSGAYGDTVDDRECNAAARPRDSQVTDLKNKIEKKKLIINDLTSSTLLRLLELNATPDTPARAAYGIECRCFMHHLRSGNKP